MNFSASQVIAVLIERLGGEPQTMTAEELNKFKSRLPCVFTLDGQTVTIEVRDDERLPREMQ